jgi:hypothetical protein
MSCIVPEENRYKIGSAMGTHRCAYVKSPRWTGFRLILSPMDDLSE